MINQKVQNFGSAEILSKTDSYNQRPQNTVNSSERDAEWKRKAFEMADAADGVIDGKIDSAEGNTINSNSTSNLETSQQSQYSTA